MNDPKCGTFQWIPKSKVDEYLGLGWTLCEGDDACHHNVWSHLMKAPEDQVLSKRDELVKLIAIAMCANPGDEWQTYVSSAENVVSTLQSKGLL